MTPDDSGTSILKEGVSDLVLKHLGITEVIGPPMAYFETGEGTEAVRHVYVSYRYGVAVDHDSALTSGYSVVILGRFKEFAPLLNAVMLDLDERLTANKPLVWRCEPYVEIERGFFKAYMRFVQVDTQEQADMAAALAKHRTCPVDDFSLCTDAACPLHGKFVLRS